MAIEARWSIAVDTGGTFTDACAVSPDGAVLRTKVLSSGRLRAGVVSVARSDDDRGIELTLDRNFGTEDHFFEGFQAETANAQATVSAWCANERRLELGGSGIEVSPGESIDLHTGEEVPLLAARLLTGTLFGALLPAMELRLATTRATNALLERKGVPPVVVLPEGFTDLLEIGDQRRPDLFALSHRKRRLPLAQVLAVGGRLDAEGKTWEQPNVAALRETVSTIPHAQRRTAAIALMHSYRDSSHEQEVERVLREMGFEHISVSSSLSPSMRILPRAQTAATDAYLAPVMNRFVGAVGAGVNPASELVMMTSAGGLEPAADFRPKDSLLSGPAGGLVGALSAAKSAGIGNVITFDMGGTSTDVARIGNGKLPYRFEQRIGDGTVMAPALRIETVAAGGGSICSLKVEGVTVGPESAGADPGPACYGRGGPLTLTDVNLLLGRIDPSRAGIPLDRDASREALGRFVQDMRTAGLPVPAETELLEGLLAMAVDRMAEAVRTVSLREGYDPADHSLVAFGGAGPGHACALADALGITRVLIPAEAGLLSARGVAEARVERFAETTVLEPLAAAIPTLAARVTELENAALSALERDGAVERRIGELRLAGQELALEFEVDEPTALPEQFSTRFAELFGYPPPDGRDIELVSLRVVAATPTAERAHRDFGSPEMVESTRVESSTFFTLVAEPGWTRSLSEDGSVLLEKSPRGGGKRLEQKALASDLTRGRLYGVVETMGAVLKRCAISTNVREREDYSCALLDADGKLAINAPHIPVHLGALGLCVREVASMIDLGPGDIAITNHPAHGGSHLPDITVIAAAFDPGGQRIGYLANRAHHAEIGGIAPGSMPPDAQSLAEEGVVIAPQLLFAGGKPQFEEITSLLVGGSHPTRNLADNLADLRAQAAALRGAVSAVEAMDAAIVRPAIEGLLARSAAIAASRIAGLEFEQRTAVERLDNGAEIRVMLRRSEDRLTVDFTGTAPTLAQNLNASPAIVRSAVLYVLRLLLDEDLPLNEGLLVPVTFVLPDCLLNPTFPPDPSECPPVVGGNVETSQRLVDTLLKALDLQAGSQGTMNNLLFGNDRFGYYETIAGGAGAGDGYAGTGALHTHMTNTAITDPEVLEWRYPVRLRRFSIRKGSGGAGRFRGGDGVVREFEFLEPLTLSILAEHRVEAPYGLAGGACGAIGKQSWTDPSGKRHDLPGRFSRELPAGSRVRIETPGGGGWGAIGQTATVPST